MSAKKDVSKTFRLTPDLAEAVDQARGDVPWSVWVTRAIEQRLARDAPTTEVLLQREDGARVFNATGHRPNCRCHVCKP